MYTNMYDKTYVLNVLTFQKFWLSVVSFWFLAKAAALQFDEVYAAPSASSLAMLLSNTREAWTER